MGIISFVVATLAAVAVAKPIPDPLNVMRQSGPAAGQVRSISGRLKSVGEASFIVLMRLYQLLTNATGLHEVQRSGSACARL